LISIGEIEEHVVRLHKEGKTMREISKMVHKNFTFIGAVLRKRFPEQYTDNCLMNRETEALRLFSEKRTPTRVAIELGSSTDETEILCKLLEIRGPDTNCMTYTKNILEISMSFALLKYITGKKNNY